MSNWIKVTSGVPQGSVPGPILFIIFMNDLDTVVENKIKRFADDCQLVGKSSSVDDRLQIPNDLDSLKLWCNV